MRGDDTRYAHRSPHRERQVHQDQSGRLWDVLFMAQHAIRVNRSGGDRLRFQLYRAPRDGKSTEVLRPTLSQRKRSDLSGVRRREAFRTDRGGLRSSTCVG